MFIVATNCSLFIVTAAFIFALQACGVDFEVKTYLAKEANNPDEKIEKKWVPFHSLCIQSSPILASPLCPTNIFSALSSSLSISYSFSCHAVPDRSSARLIIRKIQYAPSQVGPGPKADICKSFMMSDKPVHLQASIEKDVQ